MNKMNELTKDLVQQFQCPGCVCGSDITCYKNKYDISISCTKHVPGTSSSNGYKFLLGFPAGFCRLGFQHDNTTQLRIYKSFDDFQKDWGYDTYNVPVWKHFDGASTLVRGISPRINTPFIHVIYGNHLDRIECIKITQDDIQAMDY